MRKRGVLPCRLADQHTPQPEGYLQWHAWAEAKSNLYTQHKCGGCGLYVIWKKA